MRGNGNLQWAVFNFRVNPRGTALRSLARDWFWHSPSPPAGSAPASVVNSPHNLSAAGPGTVRATGEQQVCIFCHTPHNAASVPTRSGTATCPDGVHAL